ncbi:hypothetical protein PUN28_001212 [Cardiocondyla obscurior]|uniref:Uncharacterized protein n=1 Tax=Cardiocondyla obscurior TaxID=286306 RepID=A0AAW2H3U9_9HYME
MWTTQRRRCVSRTREPRRRARDCADSTRGAISRLSRILIKPAGAPQFARPARLSFPRRVKRLRRYFTSHFDDHTRNLRHQYLHF